jgi:SAM-dependent methyltransferase
MDLAAYHRTMTDRLAAAWDAQYAAGRYLGDPPVEFVDDIVRATSAAGSRSGLYVGCGNGRNYAPLVEAGLSVVGLDVSETAIRQLARRLGARGSKLIVGDLRAIAHESGFDVIVAIQVFQHGDRETTHANIRAAQRLVAVGGLMCVRVNSVSTLVYPAHDVTQRGPDGSFTIRYAEGAKASLDIHFFSRPEIDDLFTGWGVVSDLREREHRRIAPQPGHWTQWEAIYSRPTTRKAKM